MLTRDVAFRTRLYAKDANKAKWSDYEVYSAINDAVRVVAQEDIRAGNGDDFRTKRVITVTNGRAELPTGFLSEIRAFDSEGVELLNVHSDVPLETEREYSVRGTYLYAGTSPIELWYFALPPFVAADSDELAMRDKWFVPVAKAAAALLMGQDAGSVSMARYCTDQAETPAEGGSSK